MLIILIFLVFSCIISIITAYLYQSTFKLPLVITASIMLANISFMILAFGTILLALNFINGLFIAQLLASIASLSIYFYHLFFEIDSENYKILTYASIFTGFNVISPWVGYIGIRYDNNYGIIIMYPIYSIFIIIQTSLMLFSWNLKMQNSYELAKYYKTDVKMVNISLSNRINMIIVFLAISLVLYFGNLESVYLLFLGGLLFLFHAILHNKNPILKSVLTQKLKFIAFICDDRIIHTYSFNQDIVKINSKLFLQLIRDYRKFTGELVDSTSNLVHLVSDDTLTLISHSRKNNKISLILMAERKTSALSSILDYTTSIMYPEISEFEFICLIRKNFINIIDSTEELLS